MADGPRVMQHWTDQNLIRFDVTTFCTINYKKVRQQPVYGLGEEHICSPFIE